MVACYLLAMWKNSCSILHCQKGFNIIIKNHIRFPEVLEPLGARNGTILKKGLLSFASHVMSLVTSFEDILRFVTHEQARGTACAWKCDEQARGTACAWKCGRRLACIRKFACLKFACLEGDVTWDFNEEIGSYPLAGLNK